jgi:hypothetical protein
MGTWMNNDGLFIKFGDDEGRAGRGGQYADSGEPGQNVIELDVTLTSLTTSAAIQSDVAFIPSGARITKVEIYNVTAATSGGTPTIDIGLIRRDRTTELDYDGLIDGAALSTFNAVGETVAVNTAGQTAVGVLLGTTLTNSGYITVLRDATAFTGGVIKVRVYWTRV